MNSALGRKVHDVYHAECDRTANFQKQKVSADLNLNCVTDGANGNQRADTKIQGASVPRKLVNLKTAEALGLTVSRMLLALADEVITCRSAAIYGGEATLRVRNRHRMVPS